jgi:hypothetical protein
MTPDPHAAFEKERLISILQRIDGRGYGAYKDSRGVYRLHRDWILDIDHVQGDPFAAPSRLRLRLPLSIAKFPDACLTSEIRRVALCDFLTRAVHQSIQQAMRQHGQARRGSGASGLIHIDVPGQEVLPRSSVVLSNTDVEARVTVGLPARGRTVLGRQAITLLTQTLPDIADSSLRYEALSGADLERHLQVVEDQQALRDRLRTHNLVAFVADDAHLPRRAGNDDRPLQSPRRVPWQSPPTLAVHGVEAVVVDDRECIADGGVEAEVGRELQGEAGEPDAAAHIELVVLGPGGVSVQLHNQRAAAACACIKVAGRQNPGTGPRRDLAGAAEIYMADRAHTEERSAVDVNAALWLETVHLQLALRDAACARVSI